MTEQIVVDETGPIDPFLHDLATFLARIRSSPSRQPLTQIAGHEFSAGVLATLDKLEEIYSPKPI